MTLPTTLAFGDLLKQLRKRAGMTQGDLAAALGYSIALISALERNQRLPDLDAVIQHYLPALTLQDEPHLAVQLVESAATARGERPPATWTLQRERRLVISDAVLVEPLRPPLPPTALIGRDQEIAQVSKRVLGHSGRLLTLVGSPGIGKTHLALAVAAQLQPHYRDGVVFVPLAAVNDATTLVSAILTTLNSSDNNPKPPKARLIELLRRKTLLLVLDNFEQLLAPALAGGAVDLVADLLAACPSVVVLATSRERLHLRAEQRYRVPPLDLAAAVELFTQRAQAVNLDFHLTPANQPIIEAICERLDRLPLALELCAWQIELFAPAQLLAQLQRSRLAVLVDRAHDLPPQHRTLHQAIERSYGLLEEAERRLLRSLGVFAGGFALTELAAVLEERMESSDWRLPSAAIPQSLIATLHSLIGKSLVRTEAAATGEQRFLLLETIREFAAEQLRAHDEEAEVRQRHYLAYLHLFRTGDGYLRGAEATAWFARLERELDNLRAALQWTLDMARYADAAWLMIPSGYFWSSTGRRYEAAHWLLSLLPHRQTFPIELRLAFLIDFSFAASNSGEFPDVDQVRAEMIALLEICPNQHLQVLAHYFLAESAVDQAQVLALARAASEAPALGPEFGTHADVDWLLALSQLGYAGRLLDQGEIAEATALVRDSLQRFRRRGNYGFICDCLGTLAEFAWLRGDIATAHAHIQESLALSTTHNLLLNHADPQWLLGLVTLYGGDAPAARRLLEACLPFWLNLKYTVKLAQVCMSLAETALWAGELEQAAKWLEQSLAHHASPQRSTMLELQRLFIAGRLATAQGHYQRAATLFGLADTAHHQLQRVYAGPMLPFVESALATVQAALEPTTFAAAFTAGQQMSLEEVFSTILAPESKIPDLP